MMEGPWFADLSGVAGVQPYQAILPQLRPLFEKKALIAVQAASEKAQNQQIKCTTKTQTGSVVDLILENERMAELVVLGQKGEGHEITGEWLGSVVERVIRKSIKPCLIVPLEIKPIRSILMAYDGSSHANHALYTALELVTALKANLSILTVHRDSNGGKNVLKEAIEVAGKQNITANAIEAKGHADEKILETASDQNMDLIVMGAYGHNRLRELILGSVTSQVIRKSPIPVLLAR
jgi:nucleotide-binding universal stress UspA family protein